jgi:hypothetical protein
MSTPRYTCEVEQDELACRILEGLFSLDRPPNVTATEAIDAVAAHFGHFDARAAANEALAYMAECLKAVSSVQ